MSSHDAMPSHDALEQFENLKNRVTKSPFQARKLWEQVLEPQDRERLGSDLQTAWDNHRDAIGMWSALHGVAERRAILDAGLALGAISDRDHRWLLREFGEVSDDHEEMIGSAIAAGHLVLAEGPRRIYWQGEQVGEGWERYEVLWVYFLTLCQTAKRGCLLDGTSLPRKPDVSKRKNRLEKDAHLPQDLLDLIVNAGVGTQRLEIPPSSIRIFEGGDFEPVREWLPRLGGEL